MKKALLAIVLMAACLVPAGGVAHAAPSADVATVQLDEQLRACGDQRTKTESKHIEIQMQPHWTIPDWQTFEVKSIVTFVDCTGYSIVRGYTARFDKVGDYPCGDAKPIEAFRVNPNVIGGWNPDEKKRACGNPTTLIGWDAPTGTLVYDSDPSNERCIGGNIVVVMNNWPDNEDKTMPSVCLPT